MFFFKEFLESSIIINQRVDESDALILHHPQQIYILYLLVKPSAFDPCFHAFHHDAQDVLCESLLLPSLQCPVAPHRDCRVGTSGPFELSWVFLQMMHWMTASPNAWGLTFFQTKPVKNYGQMSNAIFLEAAATWNKTRHFECVVIGGFSSIFYGCCWSASGRPPTSFLSTGILPWTLGM